MKLREYLEHLNEIVNQDPKNLDLEMIYSSDDEGNNYHKVHNGPSIGKVEDLDEYYLEVEGFDDEVEEYNMICVN